MNEKEELVKAIDLLKEIEPYLRIAGEAVVVNLMYVPPAQSLRNAADEMERKEAIIRRIREYLATSKYTE